MLELDVHGLRVRAGGDWPEVLSSLALDFAWFEGARGSGAPTDADRRAPRARLRRPSRDARPRPSSRRATSSTDGERTLVDYFGRAVSVYDRGPARRSRSRARTPHLVHEAAYHFVVSRIGEHLDRIGLARLHALGLAGAAGGVAVMLPSGGGKSTLGLQALRDPTRCACSPTTRR